MSIIAVAPVISCSNTNENAKGYIEYYKFAVEKQIFDKMSGFKLSKSKTDQKAFYDAITASTDLATKIFTEVDDDKKSHDYNLFGYLFGDEKGNNKKDLNDMKKYLKLFDSKWLAPAASNDDPQLNYSNFEIADFKEDKNKNVKTFKILCSVTVIEKDEKGNEIAKESFKKQSPEFTIELVK